MSFPPRPPMGGVSGVHQFMQNMAMGVPPPVTSQPPPFFSGPPPVRGNQHQVRPPMNQPPPVSRQNNLRSHNTVIGKPSMNSDHPLPIPHPSGPSVTVFVGNITDKWPDAMIRQLLATCGQVLNWKRVQGASGKLQGFGFCDYNGPDAGLRAVRLLHDLEVGDKKLVVKVDAKTSSVLDEFKADKKKTKEDGDEVSAEQEKNDKEAEDYMDKEMVEMDERSRQRIEIIFREFKSELEQYGAAAGPEKPPKAEKDPAAKQGLQDKLHLLKLSSLDPTPNDNPPEDLEVEEGKREIISQEIGRFREYMKQEREKEDERKKMGRDRRDRDRDDPPVRRMEHSPGLSGSPGRRRSRDRSPRRDFRRRSRERDFGRVPRDIENRDWGNRRRSRDRDRRSDSTSRDRDRSPSGMSRSKYRAREEEEEARELKTQERKAREKEQAYEEKLRTWERKEGKKMKELKIIRERQKRADEETERDARKMKQFLEDYDDEKHDPKYYKGKELQKRLAERAKELEADNKDRQREREELEEMRLRVLTGGGNPAELFEKYKKPPVEAPPVSLHLAAAIKLAKKPTLSTGAAVNNRQHPGHLSQNNAVSQALHQLQQPTPLQPPQTSPSLTKVSAIPYKSPTPINNRSNSTTPNSSASPAQVHAPELSASVKSLANTGFLQSVGLNNTNSNNNVKNEDNESRQSFSDGNSPSGPSPGNSGRDDDSFQELSPEPKKKKIEVHEVFNQDEDENDGLGSGRKRKLVPLDYGDEGKKSRKDDKSQEDKKKHIKSLIDKIPTDKEALFAFIIDWDMVDNTLMERRIRPWINKKIVEYIGEPEPTLVDFICSKVLTQSSPQSILDDVMQVLDEEAEVFIVKMWRLLVYEIEAKKYGIASKT